jgi:hypothetical protein
MNLDELRILRYKNVGAKRFGFWVILADRRKINGKAARKSLIKFIESSLGPIGIKWQYEKNDREIILKFDHEHDLLFFLLKAKRD